MVVRDTELKQAEALFQGYPAANGGLMAAEQPEADFVAIENGRLLTERENPGKDRRSGEGPHLRLADSEGTVTVIARVALGEVSGPISGRLSVRADSTARGALPLLVTVALHRPTSGAYEAAGKRELPDVGRPVHFPVRLQAGPRGHINAHGELQLSLRFSGEPCTEFAGGFVVTIRSVIFERDSVEEETGRL